MDPAALQLADLIARSRRIVAFTGAGVSTESGIPDFRSPGGVWDRHAPIDFRDFLASADARRETWRRGLHTYPVVAAAEPNAAHLALVELELSGKLSAVVTQNIDGLHQKAGHGPGRVIELHGNAHGVRCLDCEARYDRPAIHARVTAGEAEPDCAGCGGTLKPTTVSFGEGMPYDELRRAEQEALACDLMLVVGSSLVVFPAAAVPQRAVDAGARLAIVNATETPLDERADMVVRGRAAVVLPLIVRAGLGSG
ncbi:MAG: Sir2 family NAD-dependent protein deacetylase [Chloroflexota bacterium]|nr:Sir2 family NAD-dependent protein deacetylase [Chloroflexota bacterium]